MKHSIGLIGLAIVGLAACQQQEPAAAPLAAPPPAEPVAAAPAAPPAALPVEASKPAPPPAATADERSKWFKDCWTAFNAKDYAKFSGCYAENATSEQVDTGMPPLSGRNSVVEMNKVFTTAFPDLTGENELTLVSGNDILSVTLLKGTQKGALPGPQGEIAATNKKIGYLALQHVVTTPDGRSVSKERFIYDGGTFLSQIGVSPAPARKALEQGWADKPSLVSSGSDAEKANLAAVGNYTAAFNKHDAPGLAATLTDDVVFSDLSAPADRVGKKEVSKSNEEMLKGFPDAKIDQTSAWAAGDYVVSTGRFSGTNSGDMPSMKLKKTGKAVNVEYYMLTKLASGKVKNVWLFSNGVAFAGQLGLLPPAKAAAKPGAPAKDPKAAAGPTAPAAKETKPAATPATPAAAATPAKPKEPQQPVLPSPVTPAPKAPGAAAAPAAPPAAAKPVAPAAAPKPPAAPAAPAAPKPPATK